MRLQNPSSVSVSYWSRRLKPISVCDWLRTHVLGKDAASSLQPIRCVELEAVLRGAAKAKASAAATAAAEMAAAAEKTETTTAACKNEERERKAWNSDAPSTVVASFTSRHQ